MEHTDNENSNKNQSAISIDLTSSNNDKIVTGYGSKSIYKVHLIMYELYVRYNNHIILIVSICKISLPSSVTNAVVLDDESTLLRDRKIIKPNRLRNI